MEKILNEINKLITEIGEQKAVVINNSKEFIPGAKRLGYYEAISYINSVNYPRLKS